MQITTDVLLLSENSLVKGNSSQRNFAMFQNGVGNFNDIFSYIHIGMTQRKHAGNINTISTKH